MLSTTSLTWVHVMWIGFAWAKENNPQFMMKLVSLNWGEGELSGAWPPVPNSLGRGGAGMNERRFSCQLCSQKGTKHCAPNKVQETDGKTTRLPLPKPEVNTRLFLHRNFGLGWLVGVLSTWQANLWSWSGHETTGLNTSHSGRRQQKQKRASLVLALKL